MFRYIRGTAHVGLEFGRLIDNVCVSGFTDSDFAKECEYRRSIST